VHESGGVARVGIVPAGGGPLSFVSGPDSLAAHPAWSPDGKRLAYVAAASGRWSVRTVPAEGGVERTVGELPQAGGRVSWSPDGRRMAVAVQADEGGWNVMVLAAEGGQPRLAVRNARAPLWLAEGRFVFVRESYPGTFDLWTVPIDVEGIPIPGGEAPLTRLRRSESVEPERGASTDGRFLFFPILVATTNDIWLGEAR
jgi:dipeptidyl aminopeptidase/acylaminoacyl peptidase